MTKTYHEGQALRLVLNRVDFRVQQGEFVAVIGRSGSGKSTLLNIIAGIDVPDGGDVLVNGTVLTDLSERKRASFRRRNVGLVFQFFNLIPTLTVDENLLLPLELNGMKDKGNLTRARGLLSRLGLEDRRGSFPDTLSGGEQQRVAIARALAHDPPLVLADEPTGNLDADTAEDVISLLERLAREKGKTLIVVTHDNRVSALADRVFTISSGQVIEQSAPARPR